MPLHDTVLRKPPRGSTLLEVLHDPLVLFRQVRFTGRTLRTNPRLLDTRRTAAVLLHFLTAVQLRTSCRQVVDPLLTFLTRQVRQVRVFEPDPDTPD